MATRLRLEEASKQAAAHPPAPGTAVMIAIDLSRTKWVYCVRWEGQEQRRLTTPAALPHVAAWWRSTQAVRCISRSRRVGSATSSHGGPPSARSA